MYSLTGKTALVTGASKGIGRGIAMALARAGAQVIVSARDHSALVQLVGEIETLGGQAMALACDVTCDDARQRLLSAVVAHTEQLDILVNNVGGGGPNVAMDSPPQLLEQVFAFNVSPAFALTQLCVPHMAGGGSIINISSAAARYAQSHFSAYGTAKAALSQLTRLLAQELAPTVRVNGIAPGPVLTDALARAVPEHLLAAMAQRTPLKRLGTVEDIAQAALFLASDASSWMTGKILELDGGAEQTVWPL
ncbi:SDR family NAD(P)-dependent oxidoreductase [Shewanella sp. GXUN23E]|uniref:SDR family NAD(P)-dependent oxidoreductase n=1 Tax=Shewanella sp. GXUN23E TaxID=3422498 RepID=UPI003D7E8301